jgi:succinyl-CoA synthetase alpha subunit
MSEVVLNEVRKGFYLDSVALMRLSREIAAMEGVIEAALMMATPANLDIMREAGLLDGTPEAGGNDLVLGLRASDEAAGRAALQVALRALDRPRGSAGAAAAWRPRTIAAAVRAMPEANLALVSVPGPFAAAEARKALRRGLNVLMFSDNVSIEDEVSLKREARDLGLLMMGPDCGTAVIGGVPLAFANRLERGPIGIVGASGTGIQEVSSLISEAGGGISHAIGVGGRDLRREVGGITTLMAMEALEADADTEAVVLISKPPHPDVAREVIERIAASTKPYVVRFIGAGDLDLPPNARQARTLREAAELAMGGKRIGAEFDVMERAAALQTNVRVGRIEGLFSGGTLAAEAQVLLKASGRDLVSNAAIPGVRGLADDKADGADRIIDLGADEYTRGRPHPMIDPGVRDDMLRAALADPAVAVVLVDLVIGYGAHDDPAGHLAQVLGKSPSAGAPVIASVTGTRLDPQNRAAQAARLCEAKVIVAPSNAHACELALAIVELADGGSGR